MPIATPQGTLDFKSVDKVTFVGASSNTVIDTTTGSLGVGVGVGGPTSNLHVVGNALITGNVTADHFVGDGSNITGISSTLQAITDSGPGANVTSNTVQFTNATTSLVASGNVEVGTDTLFVDSVNDRVGIGTDPSQLFHVHKNLPATSHHIMARIGGDTSSYNTLVFGSKEGRPHVGGHRGDFNTWADLSLQDDKLIISQGGHVNVNGTLQIQGFNAIRVLIGYQRFTTTSASYSSGSHSSWLDRWTVNYTRKHASSRIYAKGFIAVCQAIGATGTVSYRETYARFKVTQHNGSTSYGDSYRGWQRIDNSFHEYQRHAHIDVTEGVFNGTGANQNLTFTVQTYAANAAGTQNATGISVWTGRSYIEVYETMMA